MLKTFMNSVKVEGPIYVLIIGSHDLGCHYPVYFCNELNSS